MNAVDSVTINMSPYNLLQVILSPDVTICRGESITLSASATGGIPDYSLLWSNNLGTSSSVMVAPFQTTTYSMSVTDSCGSVATANVTVTIIPVQAEFTYKYETNNSINFIDHSLNGVTFKWEFGDGETSSLQFPSHIYADTGLYIVQLSVINAVGCTSIVQHGVQIYPPYHLYVPNAFTPDADGLNDYFAPVAVGVIKSEMFILNSWGGKIYQSSELYPQWDGKDSNGDKEPLGVYVYLLKYETPTGRKYTTRGSVTLVR
jgi:gliding motility-associated-like protein